MDKDFSITASELSVKYGDFTAVDNITFSVKRGEVFGFLGANGAGKTTTIRVLCGLLKPTSGKVNVGGIAYNTTEDEMAIKKKVGYMSQRFTLYNDLTIEENLNFIACLRKLDSKTYLKRREFLLNFISFKRSLNFPVKDLPGGIKQQVSLAASILHDPEIVFLDEPTAGVTPYMRARFWALIRALASEKKTVFVTTHHMDEAEQCERIALMRNGQIIALDSPNNLKKSVFPEKLYELNARAQISYQEIKRLQNQPEFSFFEPYGLHFHVAFKKTKEGENFKKKLSLNFEIQEVIPTLEDVFIKAIEGKT